MGVSLVKKRVDLSKRVCLEKGPVRASARRDGDAERVAAWLARY